MANSGPDTNGSQFFIVLAEADLPPDYTVFGSIDDVAGAVGAAMAGFRSVAGQADDQGLAGSVGLLKHHDDVLQRVGRLPRAILAREECVGLRDEGLDRRRVRGVVDLSSRHIVVGNGIGSRDADCFDVCRVATG